jgi:hypothetical protein
VVVDSPTSERFRRKRWPLLKVKVHPQLKLRLYALARKSQHSQELQSMAARALKLGIKQLEESDADQL